jgi:hypothetical protein
MKTKTFSVIVGLAAGFGKELKEKLAMKCCKRTLSLNFRLT